MDRLTKRNENGGITCENATAALKKLAKYEDAEELGRFVLLPPCNGCRVFIISDRKIAESIVHDLMFMSGSECDEIKMLFAVYVNGNRMICSERSIGRNVFLERGEAEHALAMRGVEIDAS